MTYVLVMVRELKRCKTEAEARQLRARWGKKAEEIMIVKLPPPNKVKNVKNS